MSARHSRHRGELGCSRRVSSSCSTSDTHRVNLVTNPVLSHERGKDRKCLRQVEHIRGHLWHSQPSHGGYSKTFEMEFGLRFLFVLLPLTDQCTWLRFFCLNSYCWTCAFDQYLYDGRPSSVNFIHLNFLLWNRLAKWTESWQKAYTEGPLWSLPILSRSVNKRHHHRQFLFLVFLKNHRIKLTDDGRRKTDVMTKACIAFRNLDWDFCLSCCLWQINVLDCVSFVWIHIAGHRHHHRQFLFLVFLKNHLLCNCVAKWTETWYEASM
jgi:hypothetical protein